MLNKVTKLICLMCLQLSCSLKCVDHNNNPVDWYVLYKLPIIKKSPQDFLKQGYGYGFIASNNVEAWTFPTVSINDTNSIVGLTLAPLYKQNLDLWHLLYNDEPSNTKNQNSKKGHTKGVILGDKESGIWLIHSVPKYPPKPEDGYSYSYPFTGRNFGQSFLCISLDLPNLNKVGIQLQYNKPDIYSVNVPETFMYTYPDIYKASKNMTIEAPPGYNITELISMDGVNFKSFAKNKIFGQDLYKDLVAPNLEDSLVVQTWPNGQGRMPSDCKGSYSVRNVDAVTFDPITPKAHFKSTSDHSKWAVSNLKGWVCVGDINRMVTQTKRGGGTVCLKNDKLATFYKNIMKLIEEC